MVDTGFRIYNKLPAIVKHSSTIKIFKNQKPCTALKSFNKLLIYFISMLSVVTKSQAHAPQILNLASWWTIEEKEKSVTNKFSS